MKPFQTLKGIVAPLVRPNIDTDTIIPSREMKRVSREGLAEGLFAEWRYSDPVNREPDMEFILNRSPFQEASILVSGPNFGCGSSREHAVWALAEFGIRAILAPSFGAIFERNCFTNGLLPIKLNEAALDTVLHKAALDPKHHQLHIDLEKQTLFFDAGEVLTFEISGLQKEMLLNGWDPVDRTLQQDELINGWLSEDRKSRPWVYASPGAMD